LKSTGLAKKTGLWETVGMAKQRVPHVGDRVFAVGHNSAFVVTEVNGDNQTAQLRRIGTETPTFPYLQVSWNNLSFSDAEDSSQAAARIVREATEGK
jgi:hypothetical protein